MMLPPQSSLQKHNLHLEVEVNSHAPRARKKRQLDKSCRAKGDVLFIVLHTGVIHEYRPHSPCVLNGKDYNMQLSRILLSRSVTVRRLF